MSAPELLVLAGGFGTRLRAAVADVPKPLAPVCGQPFLRYQLESWVAQGITRMTFLLHHQAALIEDFLTAVRGAGWLRGCELRTLTEPRPLGTGGAIAYAIGELKIAGSVLVTNADTWLGAGIQELSTASAPAVAVLHVADSGRYGAVRVDAESRIVAFDEKRANAGAGWINAGLYHLHPEQFRDWSGEPFSIEREVFPRLAEERCLTAMPLVADFIDIGVPVDYFRFCRWIESGKSGLL
jgi:D-glycero-alpha-D-manno-heptose 1-phosphate guanylyltransferase